MCVPAVGLVLGAVGAVASAAGSVIAGQQQARALERQADFEQEQARLEREKGEFDATREDERARRLLGLQRASYLAAGVSLEGSPGEIIEETAEDTQLDIEAIRFGAERNARNFEQRAEQSRAQASQARTAGYIGAISPIVNFGTRASLRRAF
ncbi:MAG: hypothetical protein QNJ62_06200 [Methyloceanibacter sp.]|nr:hypothetical protein [Methyloceanibacter sp.]